MHILGFTRYNKVNYIITYTNVLTCNKQGATGSRTVWFQPTIFFPSLLLSFTPNPGLYTAISMCYIHNGLNLFSFLLQFYPILFNPILFFQVGSHPGASSCPCVRGGRMKLDTWMDSNGLVRVCVCDSTLVWNNYSDKPNSNCNAHSCSQVCNGI